jgi:tetratricopeptide (TPR) repeat protein
MKDRISIEALSKVKSILLTLVLVMTVQGCALAKAGTPEAGKKPLQTTVAKDVPPLKPNKKPNMYYFLLSESFKRKGDTGKALLYLKKASSEDPGSIFLKKETARLHLVRNEISEATSIIDAGLKENPDCIEYLGVLAQIKLMQNKDGEVAPIFERILAVNPDDQAIYFLLGGLYSKMNDTKKAVATFNRLTDRFPDSFSGHFYLGRLYTIQGNYDQAETEYMDAYRLNNDLVEALYGLVQIYETQKSKTKLKEIYQTILDRDPDDIRACLALALMHHHEGQNEMALTMLERIGKRGEDTQEILKTVVKFYIKKSQYRDAIFLLRGMMGKAPMKGDYHYFMGVCYDELKDPASALLQYEYVPKESTFYEKAVLIRAFHFMDKNEHKKAIEILEKAHEEIPENTDIILYLGSFYEEVELLQKAVDLYILGLSIDKDSTKLYFRLGVAYDKKGDRLSCINEMKNVIRIDPEDANALNYLGYTYADLGMNLDEAEELITRALKFKPDDAYITDSLGWVYYKKGNYEKAVSTLEKAVSLVPDDPILLEHLGDALSKTQNKEKALECYRRSLKFKKKDTKDLEIKIEKLSKSQAVLTP